MSVFFWCLFYPRVGTLRQTAMRSASPLRGRDDGGAAHSQASAHRGARQTGAWCGFACWFLIEYQPKGGPHFLEALMLVPLHVG